MATSDHPFSVPAGWRAFRGAIGEALLATGTTGAGPVVALFDLRPPGAAPVQHDHGVEAAAALESALVACGLPPGRTLALGDDLLGVLVPTGGPHELQRLVEAVGRAPDVPPFAWGASAFPHDGAHADDLLSAAVGRLGDLRAAGHDAAEVFGSRRRRRRTVGAVAACAALLGGVLLPVALTTGPNLFTGSSSGGLAIAHSAHTAHGPGAAGAATTSPPATVPPEASPGTTSPPPPADVTTLPMAPLPTGTPDVGGGAGSESEDSPPPPSTPPSAPTTTPATTTPPPPSPTTTEPGDGGGGGVCLLLCGG